MSKSSIELRELATNSYIFACDNALTGSFCDDVIARFEANEDNHIPGRVGQQGIENTAVKRSTDLLLSGKEQWSDVDRALFQSLARVVIEMRKRYAFFKGSFKDMGYGIQRTRPGEFYHWHVDGGSHEFAYRQLVAIWYLNDVDGPGGETEFKQQGLKIKPERGKLIVFPPFWTHEHRGVTLERGIKYIATTWIVFA